MILPQENSSGRDLSLDSLINLSRLRDERRLTTIDLAPSIQKLEQETRAVLEKLAEVGMVESHGTGRGRSYTLSLKAYKKTGQKAVYVRQAGF